MGRSDATGSLAATCNNMHNIVRAQYYANEVCNSCATILAFVASFIADVIGVLEKGFTFGVQIVRK